MLIYKKRFWRSKTSSIVLLHTQKRNNIRFSESLRTKFNEENVQSELVDAIIEMLFHYDVLPSSSIPVLICWFVGPSAIEMERLSDGLVGQLCHEVLCNYLNISPESHPLDQVVK